MNGLANRNKTLGEMRTELRARLGFITQGPASKNNQVVLDSFISESYDYVYDLVAPADLRKYCTIGLLAGSYLYDYNNDVEDEPIDPSAVISMHLIVSDTIRERLRQGITVSNREDINRSQPQRYDSLNGQIEIWPVPDRGYGLLIEYTARKGRFTQDSDRPSVPYRLVFQYALALAKAHYRHPDADVAGQAFERLVAPYKGRQHENKRYFACHTVDTSHQVVRTPDGYVLR